MKPILIQAASVPAKSQVRNEFKELIGSNGYVLLVEVLHKPADTIKWLGSFRSLWVKTLKDYKGNFGNHGDSISILIDLKDTFDNSSWSHLEPGDKLLSFVTGTSLSGPYYTTIHDNAIGHRTGSHDRKGFRIGNSVVTHREFKNSIDSIKHRNKIEKKHDSALARHQLTNSWKKGSDRLWAGKRGNDVYADGVYVAHWEAKDKYIRHIYIYKRGRTHIFAKAPDDKNGPG